MKPSQAQKKLNDALDTIEKKLFKQLDAQSKRLDRCTKIVTVGSKKLLQMKKNWSSSKAQFTNELRDHEMLQTQLDQTKERLQTLEKGLDEEVKKATVALKRSMQGQQGLVEEEHRRRREDKIFLANIWPEDIVLPTMLRPFVRDTAWERMREVRRIESSERKREAAEQINAILIEQVQWSEAYNDEGSLYYFNEVTQESVWEKPFAMEYTPPDGWDVDSGAWKDGWGPDGRDKTEEEEEKAIQVALEGKNGSVGVQTALKIATTDYTAEEFHEERSSSAVRPPSHTASKVWVHHPVIVEHARAKDDADEMAKKKKKKVDGDRTEDDESGAEDGSGEEDLVASESENKDDMENKDEDEDDDESEDESESEVEVEDPLEIRVELEKNMEEEKKMQLLLESHRMEQQALTHRLLIATSARREEEHAQEEAMEKQKKDEEMKRREKIRASLLAAQAEARAALLSAKKSGREAEITVEMQQKARKRIISEEEITAVINQEDASHSNNDLEEGMEKKKKKIFTYLSSMDAVRHHKAAFHELAHEAWMEKSVREITLNETQAFESHDCIRNQMEDLLKINEKPWRVVNEKIKRKEVQQLGFENELKALEASRRVQQPSLAVLPMFPPITDYFPDNFKKESNITSVKSPSSNTPSKPKETVHVQANIAPDKDQGQDKESELEMERQLEMNRRRELGDMFQEEMHALQYEEAERVQNVDELRRKLNVLFERLLLLRDERSFLESKQTFLEEAYEEEKKRGDQLHDHSEKNKRKRAKQMIERVTGYETLQRIQDRLLHLAEQGENARRLPLQAMNAIERMHLEKKAKDRMLAIDAEYEECKRSIETEKKRSDYLMGMERKMVEKEWMDWTEEKQLQKEKSEFWGTYLSLFQHVDALYRALKHRKMKRSWNPESNDSIRVSKKATNNTMAVGEDSDDDEYHDYHEYHEYEAKKGDEKTLSSLNASEMQQDKTDTVEASQQKKEEINNLTLQTDKDAAEHQTPNDLSSFQYQPDDSDSLERLTLQFTHAFQLLKHVQTTVKMLYHRDHRWRVTLAKHESISLSEWVDNEERGAYETELKKIQQQSEERLLEMQREAEKHQRRVEELEGQVTAQQNEMQKVLHFYNLSNQEIIGSSVHSIEHLIQSIQEKEKEMLALKQDQSKDMDRFVNEHSAIRLELEGKVEVLTTETQRRQAWIETLKTELTEQKLVNEQLVNSYQSLEKQRSDEMASLKTQLSTQLKKVHHLEMWNASIKKRVEELNDVIEFTKHKMEQMEIDHRGEQRKLRFVIWKHRITAQIILTTPKELFRFFLHGLLKLAGATQGLNDDIRHMGGIHVLIALCQSPNIEIKSLAAKAIGEICWNGNLVPRFIGWTAKKLWLAWVERLSTEQTTKIQLAHREFDSKMPEDSEDMNVFADGEDEVNDQAFMRDTKKPVRKGMKQWALRSVSMEETPNVTNQESIGQASGALQTLVLMAQSNDAEVQRSALSALSVACLSERNNGIMGRMKGCVQVLLNSLSYDDVESQRHGAMAIANMSYQNKYNQQLVFEKEGISKLLLLCRSEDVDVLLSTTAALANLSHDHQGIVEAILHLNGMVILVDLCHSHHIADLIQSNVQDEIQSNCSECLVNLVQFDTPSIVSAVQARGVQPFLLLCASKNRVMQNHGALIIGNLAQNDSIRDDLGEQGAVAILFQLIQTNNPEITKNALWSLSNLVWNRANQERVLLHYPILFNLCLDREKAYSIDIQGNALKAFANSLFFNHENRAYVGKQSGWLTALLALGKEGLKGPSRITWEHTEHISRALSALAYRNENALFMGEHGFIEYFIALCASPPTAATATATAASTIAQRNAVFGLINLGLHDVNKKRILDSNGVEALVELSAGSADMDVRESAKEALAMLAELPQVNELQERKAKFGLTSMIAMCRLNNDLLSSMAAESIAEAIWNEPQQQVQVRKDRGIDALLDLLETSRSKKTLQPTLWALRNAAYHNVDNQNQIGLLGGVERIFQAIARMDNDPSVIEASLAALVNLAMDHEKNSRRILCHGLDLLIDLADGKINGPNDARQEANEHGHLNKTKEEEEEEEEKEKGGGTGSGVCNASVARDLLRIIGPHNWIECRHCHHKERGGNRCSQCGRTIQFIIT